MEGGWGFAGKAGWEGVFLCVFWGMGAEGVFFKEQKIEFYGYMRDTDHGPCLIWTKFM